MLNPKLRADLIPGDSYWHRFADGTVTLVTVVTDPEDMDTDRFGRPVFGYTARADGRVGWELFGEGAEIDVASPAEVAVWVQENS